MRKILLLASLVLASCPLFSQTFTGNSLDYRNAQFLQDVFYDYEVYELNATDLDNHLRTAPDRTTNLTLALGDDYRWDLELSPSNIIAPNYRVRLLTENGEVTDGSVPSIMTFKGKLTGQPESRVRLTVDGDFIQGYVVDRGEMFYIEPVRHFSDTQPTTNYVVYSVQDVQPRTNKQCGVTRLMEEQARLERQEIEPQPRGSRATFTVEYAVASDYLQFLETGGTVDDATDFVVAVTNEIEGDYTNDANPQLLDDYNFTIVEQLVVTCPGCDPWTTDTDPSSLLNDFRTFGNSGGFSTTFDDASLWTARDFDGSTVGLAYIGTVCNFSRYNINENVGGMTSATVRAIASHEIGHNFNANHNYNGGAPSGCTVSYIMNPTVSAVANAWSNSTADPCVTKGITTVTEIDNYTSSISCLDNLPSVCGPVENLIVSTPNTTTVSLQWDAAAGATSYTVRLFNPTTDATISTQNVSGTQVTINNAGLANCTRYGVTISANCASGTVSFKTDYFETEATTRVAISDLIISGCTQNGGSSTYDLTLTITYGTGDGNGFRVTADGETRTFSFTGSPQTVVIAGLTGNGTVGNTLTVSPVASNGGLCNASITYNEPEADCSVVFDAHDFDDCERPAGWTDATTNSLGFNPPFEWKYQGSGRTIFNYGGTVGQYNGADASETINGTCMAIFDDDIFSSIFFDGTVTLTTDVIDLSDYQNTMLTFVYNFHKFEDSNLSGSDGTSGGGTVSKGSNNSQFTVEAFDGATWNQILLDNTDVCTYNNVWNNTCETNATINLAAYTNSDFQLRFIYTDGNSDDWTGMVAFDDYALSGQFTAPSVFPVVLTDFNGRRAEDHIQLNWTTAQERNADHFLVERSHDGVEFEQIARVAATGDSDTEQQYTTPDRKPLVGTNYYRLRQVDLDGTEYVERTIAVDFSGEVGLSVVPNPVLEDQVGVLYDSPERTSLSVEIIDLNGRILLNRRFELERGTNRLNISATELPTGMYLMRTLRGNDLRTVRFVVR